MVDPLSALPASSEELTSAAGQMTGTFSYDTRGNMTGRVQGNTWTYTYDHGNRLTQVGKNNSPTGAYVYDADGMRVKKTENGVTTVYLAVGYKIYYEVTNEESTKHIYAGERKIAEVKGGVTSYLHNDHQGSVKVITDASGTVVATMDTKPFGEPYPAATAPPTDYLYTGKELDDSGLYYYAARYYDPKLGRFTVPDTWVRMLL